MRRGLASWAIAFAAFQAAPAVGSAEKPPAAQGYLGLQLRDFPGGHALVSNVLPGPLQGGGLTSPTLCRPDLVVSVNGAAMSAEEFARFVRDSAPGAGVTIRYRRSKARGPSFPSSLDHEETIETVEAVLDSRETWTGTLGRPRGHEGSVEFQDAPLLDPRDPANVLGAAVSEHQLIEPLDVLLRVFRERQRKDEDFHSLSRVRVGFDEPFRLAELERLVDEPVSRTAGDPVGVAAEMIGACLDLQSMPAVLDTEHECAHAVHGLMEHLVEMDQAMRGALGDAWGDEALARQAVELLRVPRTTFYIQGESTRQHLAVIRRSMSLKFDSMQAALTAMRYLAALTPHDMTAKAPTSLPAALEGAVDGPILSAREVHGIGWVVAGSAEANRYDMARIAAVIDIGGNDRYEASGPRLGSRVIIDLAGDDVYTGTEDQGPGSALLGASFIDDRAGNDRYEGRMLSAGAAMFGMSVLLDRAGNDGYVGSDWSLGAAAYGAGVIVDLGGGADTYIGEYLCQGVGGPRGLGAIIDENGNDLYRTNGPQKSAYDTPAVYQSFSQGMGFGFRQYAAGGIGVINDLGGDDRYEAGEFAQGGAYYYGLGILHDARGRDFYYGNRYGQGFGVHQALGILADDEGDDTYWSMTAASQGAAWDIGAGLLIDRAGNDSYQCDGLGQGGAAMQGIAMLVDLEGTDRYSARGGATQGESGDNAYHYFQTGAFSFSLLLDSGGGPDWYSTGRANNRSQATGKRSEASPQNSPLHGVVIDR